MQLLNSSGTPNALMPQKVSELAEALKAMLGWMVIVEKWCLGNQTSWHGAHVWAVLCSSWSSECQSDKISITMFLPNRTSRD